MDFFDINHLITDPISTSVIVSHFRCLGRMNGEGFIGSIHWIAAPLIIEHADNTIIGVTMFVCSIIDEYGEWAQGLHSTAIENRTE